MAITPKQAYEAAPELLEALVAIVNANNGVSVMPTPEARQQNAALKKAKAAIKKATGE